MNAAESLVRTLVAAGVDTCFTNPGTSEMHFVAALDRVPGIRPILALFEGVVAGAADGFGRMSGRPAATLLHLGPGLGNAIANLHNAKKAHTPIVNLVGNHALRHQAFDAPLSSDVEALARPVSAWVRQARDPAALAADAAAAVAAACAPPGGIATLVVPADVAWGEATGPAPALPLRKPETVAPEAVREAARALRSGEPAVLLMSGAALGARPLESAGRIAAATGARLFCDTFNARLARGAGRVFVPTLPYFAEGALEALAGTRHLVLIGTQPPVAFFAYPGKPSALTPEGCVVHALAGREHDAPAALEALADELGAHRSAPALEPLRRPEPPRGKAGVGAIATSLAALLPEHAIVVDEAITGSLGPLQATRTAAPHDWLFLTGGAIGQGLPVATGAAVACPDRKVVCLEGDGSAMYTIQSLWTQAREGLDVTSVIFANRSYAILRIELARMGMGEPGPRAQSLLGIGSPELDFVRLAEAQGVPATRATTADELHAQLAASLSTPGPHLIEVVY
jgi:acetolactate synthase-1/2/3 large subunit